jgi:cytochrome c oxidase subunit IV
MAGEHGHTHHIVPPSTYMKVLLVLLFLTVLTVVAAPPFWAKMGVTLHLGAFSAIIAFAIASVKAALVLAIFMGLKYDNKLNLAIILSGVFFLVLLLFVCLGDIYTRLPVNSTL